MFISSILIDDFNKINLIQLYYSKNRGCYGNGNLVAGNIKKGISIFGVSGSYYETKRYLIQNGALCGNTSIVEIEFQSDSDDSWYTISPLTSPRVETVNGNKYIRMIWSDRYSNPHSTYMYIIRNAIGNIVNLSSNDKNGRLPGAICMDAATMGFSTIAYIYAWFVIKPSTNSANALRWSLAPNMTTTQSGYLQYTPASYTQTGIGNTSFSSRLRTISAANSNLHHGDMTLDCANSANGIAVRNLWIDTSKSI